MLVDRLAPKVMEDNPLWLIVLCDLMTNLMLFFMVLFAFSQMDEEDRKRIAEGLSKSISQTMKEKKEETPAKKRAEEVMVKYQEKQMVGELEHFLHGKGLYSGLEVSADEINLKLPNPALFPPGRAELSALSRRDIQTMAEILAKLPGVMIAVEGYTDDQPLGKNSPYRSNWHLSAARANAVVEVLASADLPANRLVTAGYGEYKPVASNKTAEGRAANRRIQIRILKRAFLFEGFKERQEWLDQMLEAGN
ncbi:MAG: flagellar motor protein MotB [Elusimicrobia bacterium]|nr:flagellar motor protein MotB [Elusimicrobiota bacterium]